MYPHPGYVCCTEDLSRIDGIDISTIGLEDLRNRIVSCDDNSQQLSRSHQSDRL